mmetsp:Transcript_5427/g.11923  ORF Transcript_5427/g.11923 Transcript_5427/m.11923 type:complete len:175 (-) Transcript_5427:196-720(-)
MSLPRISLTLTVVAAALTSSGSAKSIGDVLSETESLRGSSSSPTKQNQRSLNSNSEILAAMLSKEHFEIEKDECLDRIDPVNGTAIYTTCDIRRFPYCNGNRPNICFNRINRQDAFWPDKHPKYYIDYNRVHCYPDRINNVDFTCSSCSPGRWCMPEGRCILDEKMYGCWTNDE